MERVIAVIGPTAVGKTRVSIDLALKLNTEIISGDSMLVYKNMDIGTAKPTISDRCGIPHHLIDILPPEADFSVAEFQGMAAEHIGRINADGRIPIIAGGTGLYVQALLEGYQFTPAPANAMIRERFEELARNHGSAYIHDLLRQAAPEMAAKLHPNDTRRVVRALEVYYCDGGQPSRSKSSPDGSCIYDSLVIGLTMDRSLLYDRINKRVDIMLEQGLIEEVRYLMNEGITPHCQSMQGIGYKEMITYLKGESDLESAVTRIKQATRNFAKRQLTWYRKMPYIKWVQADAFDNYDKMLAYIYSLVAGKFFLK